ncbi:hypothetical protein [Denitratisoma oestradiolicum]|uniref:Uncharacterized protein n=1 Tax=Denitratisoma oestradiolicum TaxID=311182 RepID=A0A6S6XPN4_9PROT|nr:hypothetical protein [Denitratisoma oestradiolicum]TWO81162.1 hypothetical protein CBW56_06050 [Denitratisoma oestradiolicum]CAB1367856.1 conserved protein of unknown function [Denitratisoma oestradiolicum]
MHPIHDVDVVILMATMLSSKRRPAELAEIVAGADLIQGFIPFPDKLGDAMTRLSYHGLIQAVEGGYTLTPAAQDLLADLPRKGEMPERIAHLREILLAYNPRAEHPVIELKMVELSAAVLAHRGAKKEPGKNLLMPKPKPDRHFKVEGRWRRASASRGRKP